MPEDLTTWPVKKRDLHNHHMDSTVWDEIRFRNGDIVIATYGKSGTTWMQQIVAQLLFENADEVPVSEMSPWVDMRVQPRAEKLAALEAQTHRRFMKTHLPLDALVYAPQAKYIYLGRDGRDVVWSLYNHHATANALWYQAINDTPGRAGPPISPPRDSIREYFLEWLEKDGYPFWPFWENVASWWAHRNLPNLLLLHFGELKRDLPGAMRRLAAFLDVPVDEARFPTQVAHCTFDWMKAHAEHTVPAGGAFWEHGAADFINKGVNGRWRDTLTAGDSARYEAMARERLGAACAAWLATGER